MGKMIIALALVAALATPVGSSWAGPPLSSYVVYGENGIAIGAGSIITGLVGARNNNAGTGVAIRLNGRAQVSGDARSGADVSLGNNAHITGQLVRGPGLTSLTLGDGATVGVDVPNTDPELPVLPAPAPVTCPTGGPDDSGGNGETRTPPLVNGALTFGGRFTLNLTTVGDYYFDSIRTGNGAKINAVPGVRVFVCGSAHFGSATVLPATLLASDVTWEVQGSANDAFRANGATKWIGDVYAPNGGITIGGSGSETLFTAHLHARSVVSIKHSVFGHNGEEQPGNGEHPGGKDATILHGIKDTNNGANLSVRVGTGVATLVGFDLSSVATPVSSAILRLTVCFTPGVPDFCPEPSRNWPAAGGKIFAYRLDPGFEDWAEGNGNNFPIPRNPRGTGPGVTWNCKTDADIANEAADCSGADFWGNGGRSVQGSPRGPSVPLVTSGMGNGTVVEFDVTDDVNAGLAPDLEFMSWFVRKPEGAGAISFYSREGADAVGLPGLAPQLIITP